MHTNRAQQRARAKRNAQRKRMDASAIFLLLASWVAALVAGWGFFEADSLPRAHYYVVGIASASSLVVCATSLLMAESDETVWPSSVTLLILGGVIYLFVPEHLHDWPPGLLSRILFSFALLCFAAGAVAFLRDTFGNSSWLQVHDKYFAVLFSACLVWAAVLKDATFPRSSELFDLCLAFAGVGFGAMLEKKREEKM